MKRIIKSLVTKLLKLLPKWTLKNIIVFESVPDISDNTRAVFDEMVKRNMNKKYKLVWLVNDCNHSIKNVHNVVLVNKNSKKKYKYILSSKCNICCNGKLYSWRRGQYSIYLGHGIPIKTIRTGVSNMSEKIDNWLITAESVKELFAYEFRADVGRGVALGYPRNDAFSMEPIEVKNFFEGEFDKVIMWYPTFRQNHGGISASDSDVALPIIHNEEKAIKLNDFLKQKNAMILIKPHFAQDLDKIKDLNLTNIKFLYDDFYFKNELNAYQFVGSCDALLTDYSSIYYDYMLVDKPIGLVWEDYEEYGKRPGFAVDMEFYMKGGEKIYTLEDLMSFISNVCSDDDICKTERNEICSLVHYATDGKNAERVVDFIIKRARL